MQDRLSERHLDYFEPMVLSKIFKTLKLQPKYSLTKQSDTSLILLLYEVNSLKPGSAFRILVVYQSAGFF